MQRPSVCLGILSTCMALRAGDEPPAPAHEALTVAVNGASWSAKVPYYLIYPGRANSLTLRADFAKIGKQAWTATLVRTCPDGRSDAATAKLTPELPQAVLDLGAFAVPAEYDYEHGVVYRRGYRFTLTVVAADGKTLATFDFYQGLARAAEAEALWLGAAERHVYNGGYDSGKGWQPNKESGRPMDPPFLLQLDWAVLFDPNDVRVQYGQKDGLGLATVPAELVVVRGRDG